MAAYDNSKRSDNKKTILREKDDKKYSNVEYEKNEHQAIHRFDNYDEEITCGDLADLLSYAKQFTGVDASTTILVTDQPDEPSSNGPAETKTITAADAGRARRRTRQAK